MKLLSLSRREATTAHTALCLRKPFLRPPSPVVVAGLRGLGYGGHRQWCNGGAQLRGRRRQRQQLLGGGSSNSSSRSSGVRLLSTLVSAAELKFGQPVHETHPHLLRPGEVTPGITALEYATRRANLAAKLPRMAIAIVAAAELQYRSGPVFYPFHQDPSFFYLTGFNEPEAVAIIEKTGDGAEHIFHLFVQPKDDAVELWEGARSGVQAAEDVFNADQAGDVNSLPSVLPKIIDRAEKVFTDLVARTTRSSSFARMLGARSPRESGFQTYLENAHVAPLKPLLNELRVIKSKAEIENMRTAGRASGRAITNAMRRRFPTEKALAAFIEHGFILGGCATSAYVPVVAGGENALSIHYVRHDDLLRDGDLVLVDAGGVYGGYATDITRTWPVNGKFSPAQRDLYEAVLRVQRTCVSLCSQHANMSLDKLHDIAAEGLSEQLKQLGFDLNGDALSTLFPHHVGHYLGLDLHDTPGHSRKELLRAGHCITIEPGLYVPNDRRWPERFRGLGIRIEDSVCVQEDGPLILTTEALKEVVDIEAAAADSITYSATALEAHATPRT